MQNPHLLYVWNNRNINNAPKPMYRICIAPKTPCPICLVDGSADVSGCWARPLNALKRTGGIVGDDDDDRWWWLLWWVLLVMARGGGDDVRGTKSSGRERACANVKLDMTLKTQRARRMSEDNGDDDNGAEEPNPNQPGRYMHVFIERKRARERTGVGRR